MTIDVRVRDLYGEGSAVCSRFQGVENLARLVSLLASKLRLLLRSLRGWYPTWFFLRSQLLDIFWATRLVGHLQAIWIHGQDQLTLPKLATEWKMFGKGNAFLLKFLNISSKNSLILGIFLCHFDCSFLTILSELKLERSAVYHFIVAYISRRCEMKCIWLAQFFFCFRVLRLRRIAHWHECRFWQPTFPCWLKANWERVDCSWHHH